MRIAMSLNVFHESDAIARMFDRCREAGFDAVDFNYTDRQYEFAEVTPQEELAVAHEVARASRESGLPVVQMHGPIYPKFADEPKTRRMYEQSLRCFEFAAVIGSPWVVFEPDVTPGVYTPSHVAANLAANVELFGTFAEAARRAGTGVAVENVPDRPRGLGRAFGATPAELLGLLEGIGASNVGICWDTGHAHMQGLNQREALTMLGSRVVALHIADNDRSGDQHVLPFMGTISWQDVMLGLRQGGYGGYFVYEAHNSIRKAPDCLRDGLLRHAANLARLLTSEPWVNEAVAG